MVMYTKRSRTFSGMFELILAVLERLCPLQYRRLGYSLTGQSMSRAAPQALTLYIPCGK